MMPVLEQTVVTPQLVLDQPEGVHPGAATRAAQVHGGREDQRPGEIGAQQSARWRSSAVF